MVFGDSSHLYDSCVVRLTSGVKSLMSSCADATGLKRLQMIQGTRAFSQSFKRPETYRSCDPVLFVFSSFTPRFPNNFSTPWLVSVL